MVWVLALAGVACLWFLPKAPHAAIVGLYLGLGWLTVLPMPLLYQAVGWRAMNWVWLGAAFYSAGAICELTQWPVIVPGWVSFHEVLHFCDSAASIAFFLFVVRYVIPYEQKPRRETIPESAPEAPASPPVFPSVLCRNDEPSMNSRNLLEPT